MPHVCHFPGCGHSAKDKKQCELKHLKLDQSKPYKNDWRIEINIEFPEWTFTGKVLNICSCHFDRGTEEIVIRKQDIELYELKKKSLPLTNYRKRFSNDQL